MIYTIREFRQNTREILNAVDQGAEVTITRYGQEYSVIPKATGTFVVDPEARKAIDLADSDSTILENGKVVKKIDMAKLARPQGKTAAAKKIVEQAQNKKVTPKQQKLDRAVADETGLCSHFQKKGQCMVKGCKYGSKG